MSKNNDYDVIIIGAGIGGLVCGCYLAKAGVKTLIVEKNAQVGGYCTSFSKKGFTFDACAHSFGSCREDGNIGKIVSELGLSSELNFKRYDPSDVIIIPKATVSFYANQRKTNNSFQEQFPEEKDNIVAFFKFIKRMKGMALAKLRNKTFKDVIDSFFKDKNLKAILALPILGNGGLPPSLTSAVTAISIYNEFIIDGGYYLGESVQEFPDVLAGKFKSYGGDLRCSNKVTKIKVESSVKGVLLKNNNFISSKYVVSDCDAMQTFFNLVGKKILPPKTVDMLQQMVPSSSMFILYLGVDNKTCSLPVEGRNIWFMSNFNIKKMHIDSMQRGENGPSWFMTRVMPNRKSLLVFTNAGFNSKEYWKAAKEKVTNDLICETEKVIPNLSKSIIFKEAATPNTLLKWTLNYRGAAYGWATFPSQLAVAGLSQITPIKNLYLTGHWTTFVQGIPGVTYLGRNTAERILKEEGKD